MLKFYSGEPQPADISQSANLEGGENWWKSKQHCYSYSCSLLRLAFFKKAVKFRISWPRLSVLLEETELDNSVHGNARQAAHGSHTQGTFFFATLDFQWFPWMLPMVSLPGYLPMTCSSKRFW